MTERRKPLILLSTKTIVDSVLNSSKSIAGDGGEIYSTDPSSLQLKAGIIRPSSVSLGHGVPKEALLDDAALVGVSISVLIRLCITSGSLVLVKNIDTNVGRIGRVVVLDPPDTKFPVQSTFHSSCAMTVLPSYAFSSNCLTLDREVAYLSPLLAFNLGLHTSCLQVLIRGGPESIKSLFQAKDVCDENVTKDSAVHIELMPWLHLPRYASHLRVSFVKIPECGLLESLKGSSPIEAEDRQEMIDSALHHYFKVDRYLARGDNFYICIKWNCNSEACISCSRKSHENGRGVIIHFKVCCAVSLSILFKQLTKLMF